MQCQTCRMEQGIQILVGGGEVRGKGRQVVNRSVGRGSRQAGSLLPVGCPAKWKLTLSSTTVHQHQNVVSQE